MSKIFIAIPEKGTDIRHYVKPYDIEYIVEEKETTIIYFKLLDKMRSIYTLLGAEEIHKVIQEMEADSLSIFKFGDED